MPSSQFARDGYLGPTPVFTQAQCRRIADYLRRTPTPAPAGWEKARAVHERFIYEIATWPAVLAPVSELLGEDVVLWGASAVRRIPGQTHPWHCDIESCAPEGGFVTVWVGSSTPAVTRPSRSLRGRISWVGRCRRSVGRPASGAS